MVSAQHKRYRRTKATVKNIRFANNEIAKVNQSKIEAFGAFRRYWIEWNGTPAMSWCDHAGFPQTTDTIDAFFLRHLCSEHIWQLKNQLS